MQVAVVGGGITGLTAAYRLVKSSSDADEPIEVSLLEASSRTGGIIETLEYEDCLVEMGPDSMTTLKHCALEFCRELGLTDHLISTKSQNRRALIARHGVLNPIPRGFVLIAPGQYDTFFKSNILSRTGKLRMAMEQFIAPTTTALEDESVASFVRRRFGPEAVTAIAQPMIGGIYTSDIDKLSLRATMPKFLDYEQKYGSVAAGLRRDERDSKKVMQPPQSQVPATDIALDNHEAESGGARYSAFVSFDRGMQVLVNRLVELIGKENIHLNMPVDSLTRVPEGWVIGFANGSNRFFDQVILAVPTRVASQLLKSIDADISARFAQIRYASSAVACMIVSRSQITHSLNGFGFVVPASEKRSILACSFSSLKFAGRCPDDKVILRIFMGGALDPEMWQYPDDELLKMAIRDLHYYIGFSGMPERQWVKRWPQSMPQYDVGHLSLVEVIEESLSRLKGLHYAGAGLKGVGIPDCIAAGESAARAVSPL